MKNLKTIVLTGLILVSAGMFAQNKDDKKIINDADKAKATLLKTDKGLQEYFDDAAGYVLFPNVGKGGLIIGAASGNGAVYENGTLVGMANLKKLNIGLQAGGQAVIEVIFFETEEALKKFKSGKFEFSAEASAVALKTGISTDADYEDGVVVFALPKEGLMADASVGGQKFSYKPIK